MKQTKTINSIIPFFYLISLLFSTNIYANADVVPDASMVDTYTTNFNNNLSSADNTVQKALDTLDNLVAASGLTIGTTTITSGTNGRLLYDNSGVVGELTTATYPSLTELSYVKGVTSAIQTQIDSKQASGNYITALTGDVTASGPGSVAATLKNTGTAGTYRSTTFDAQGRETSGTNPTTFSGYGISDTSANLAAALSDETGSSGGGVSVFSNAPALTSPTVTTQSANDNSTKAASTAYVDNAILAQNFKEAVKIATTANLVGLYSNGASGVGATFTYTALGVDVIDGTNLALNDRVLLKNQTSDFQNGIYKVTTAGAIGVAGILTRAIDADQTNEYATGDSVFVTSGTALGSTTWAYTGIDSPTMGTTSLTYVQVAGQGSFTGGTGITITGTSIALTAPVTVALGGTNATSASITAFNNITGYTASGATGTTSTNLVFSTSPALTTPILGTPTSGNLANCTFPTLNQNTSGSAATLTTARTIGGTSFNGSANIDPLEIVPTTTPADSTGFGIIVAYTYGESITLGAPLYFKSDGKVYNADANGSSTYPVIGIALATASSGTNNVLLRGIYQFASAHTDFTVGGLVYLSTTVGTLTQTQPVATDDVIQVVGVAVGVDTLLVNPSSDYITHT